MITKIKHVKIKQKKYYFDVNHIYEDIWNAVVGRVLVCEKKPNNSQDRYAVAAKMKFRVFNFHA